MIPLLSACGAIAGLYVMLGIVIFVFQNKLVFPGGTLSERTPSSPPFGWEYQNILLRVGEETTHAWFIPLENARGTALFSHGNGGAISERLESCAMLRRLGLSVLVYDYGGYGRSTGGSSEERCYKDARAMWQYLTSDLGVPREKVLLFGRSLGGAVTLQLATEVRPGAIIVESTFLSMPEIAQEKARIYPMRLLMRSRFDNAAKVARVSAPVLLLHSPDDTLIPFRHGRTLFDLAREPKEFFTLRGDHHEGFILSEPDYSMALEAFVRKTLN